MCDRFVINRSGGKRGNQSEYDEMKFHNIEILR